MKALTAKSWHSKSKGICAGVLPAWRVHQARLRHPESVFRPLTSHLSLTQWHQLPFPLRQTHLCITTVLKVYTRVVQVDPSLPCLPLDTTNAKGYIPLMMNWLPQLEPCVQDLVPPSVPGTLQVEAWGGGNFEGSQLLTLKFKLRFHFSGPFKSAMLRLLPVSCVCLFE